VYVRSDSGSEFDLGEEKAMKLFGSPKNAVKKWRTRALFIDLHKTRVTICESDRKHVPPWVFKQLMGLQKDGNRT